MDTVHRGDLIIVDVEYIKGQRVLASTNYWNDIDEVSVENPERIPFDESSQARVTSVSFGRATAVPCSSTRHGISPGEQFTVRLCNLIDGHPGTTDTPGKINKIIAPDATLGEKVVGVVYQIHDGVGYIAIKEIVEQGLSVGDRVAVTVRRMQDQGTLDVRYLDELSVSLEKPVVIGGHAVVELTQVDGGLAGKIVELDFIPQTSDTFKMAVKRDSDQADPEWENLRGIDTINLECTSIGSDKAVVEITSVGETFSGKIIEYCNPPMPGQTVDAVVSSDQKKARMNSPEYNLLLNEERGLDGEAQVQIQRGVEINETIVLPRAELISYDRVPTEGEIVNAKLDESGQTARTYSDELTISLDRHISDSGFAKVEITHVEKTELEGRVVEHDINDESEDDKQTNQNPFAKDYGSRNSDLTGTKF